MTAFRNIKQHPLTSKMVSACFSTAVVTAVGFTCIVYTFGTHPDPSAEQYLVLAKQLLQATAEWTFIGTLIGTTLSSAVFNNSSSSAHSLPETCANTAGPRTR